MEVRWDEVADLGTVVRRKIYVRSEPHYRVPAYYFVAGGTHSCHRVTMDARSCSA